MTSTTANNSLSLSLSLLAHKFNSAYKTNSIRESNPALKDISACKNSSARKNAFLPALVSAPMLIATTILAVPFVLGGNVLIGNSASATSTKTTVRVSPTIRLTLTGGNLTIGNLSPGSYADSNIITADVVTNSTYGYYLSATTGTSTGTGNTTNLTNNTNSNYTFTSLSTNASSLSNFPDNTNTWGYSYSTDNGTTWISGNQGNTTTGYNGLPLDHGDNGATGIILRSTNTTSDSTISTKFKIGARSTSNQPSGTYTGVVNFYAVANPVPAVYIQDITYCPSVPTEVTDIRDNQTYRIQKLADGNCWMLDNLALDLVDPAVQANLNSDTTNASDATLNYLTNGGGSGQYTSTPAAYADSSNPYDAPRIVVGGNCYDAYCVNDPESGKWQSSSATQTTINGTTSISQGKIGAYYNYCAASAGSYCYASSSGIGDAEYDICPAGWRLPTSGSSGEYRALYTAYSSNYSTFQTALATPLSGYLYSGTASNQGYGGYFWSSAIYDTSNMYSLYVDSTNVRPSNGDYRSNGNSIRCVLDYPPYMQDVTSSRLAKLMPNIGDTATLIDKRDGQEYKVGKLADEKYWMLENLSLDLTTVSLDDLKGNTNATDESLTYLKNGGGSSPYTGTAVAYAGSSNTYDTPQIAVSGTCYDAYCVNTPTSGNWTSEATTNNLSGVSKGTIGIYYNYCAVSAGSYCYASGSGTGNASQDICPAGWRLPTGDSSGEYNALYTAYSSNYPTFQTALATPLSGNFNSGTARDQGYYGIFWSSTINDTSRMYRLDVYSANVNPSNNGGRYYGYSVRCVRSAT